MQHPQILLERQLFDFAPHVLKAYKDLSLRGVYQIKHPHHNAMAEKSSPAGRALQSPADSPHSLSRVIPTLDPVIEKRVLRKLDWTVVPVLWFLFIVSFVDRGNIGRRTDSGHPQ